MSHAASPSDKVPVYTPAAPLPGGAYSQAIRRGNILYTAGLGPHDPVSRRVVGTTIEEQTRQTLRNLEAVLAAAGASLRDVVKVTVHLQDPERDFAGFDRTYREIMPEPWPARTTVGSRLLGILVEIDMLAVLG
jgi:2-iminobutanoate/2-iminopropanoate deaminase